MIKNNSKDKNNWTQKGRQHSKSQSDKILREFMTQDTPVLKELKESIRYRVEQEYQKYHDKIYTDKDFWIEQITWKLADTISELIATKEREAQIQMLREIITDLEKNDFHTIYGKLSAWLQGLEMGYPDPPIAELRNTKVEKRWGDNATWSIDSEVEK